MSSNHSKLDVVYRFFSGTGFSYDQVVTVCTSGFDRYWKRRIIAAIPSHPARILDQACGTGILTLGIARGFPAVRSPASSSVMSTLIWPERRPGRQG